MKAIKLIGITLIAVVFSAQVMAQARISRRTAEPKEQTTEANKGDQQLVVPLSEPGKPYKLNVSLTFGSIHVTGYDGKDVVIDVTSSDKKKHDRGGDGMKRLSGGENVDVVAHEKNNEVNISNGSPLQVVVLNIKVPQGATSVKLNATNDGDVVASNLNCPIEVQHTNGSIELKDVSGSVVANTTNGNVVVKLKSVDPKAPMAFTTLNGNVDVTLPASTKANIKARSERDNIFSDFEFTAEPSQAKTSKTAKDGLYRLTVEDWVIGKIGGGGPEMLFKTMNGNIYIRKVK